MGLRQAWALEYYQPPPSLLRVIEGLEIWGQAPTH